MSERSGSASHRARRAAAAAVACLSLGACVGGDPPTEPVPPPPSSVAEGIPTAPPDDPPVGPEPAATDPPTPGRFAVGPLRGPVRRHTVRTNWHRGCPVGPAQLRMLTVTYVGFDGDRKRGPLVVHRRVAGEVLRVFRALFRERFPIKHVALPPRYRPNLDGYNRTRSVTAGFNCRPVTDGTSWSEHAFGLAVDINPLQNPYVRADGSVLRAAARPYRDRSIRRPGMIREGDVVVRAFDRFDWAWGGRWASIKDYMHFSAGGS